MKRIMMAFEIVLSMEFILSFSDIHIYTKKEKMHKNDSVYGLFIFPEAAR